MIWQYLSDCKDAVVVPGFPSESPKEKANVHKYISVKYQIKRNLQMSDNVITRSNGTFVSHSECFNITFPFIFVHLFCFGIERK